MLPGIDKILEFNQYVHPDKMPYIIYADMEPSIKNIDACPNNPENSSATKVGEHIPCGYSMSNIWVFDHIEIKHTLYCEKYCMKKFCNFLGNITDFEKKKMLPLRNEELKSCQNKKCVIFVEKDS